MRIAYFDCFSGISGDMVLGALLDVGADSAAVRDGLAKLPLTEYILAAKEVTRSGISCTKVSVRTVEKGVVRTWSNVRQVIQQSSLNDNVKARCLAIFQSLAEAEANIYRKNVETIHFHEVGVVDSIVDVVGSAIAFELLGVDRVLFSPFPMGIGMTRTERGTMLPIPSPVTIDILKGKPVYSTGMQVELVTPTGAAIAASCGHEFGNMPPLIIEKIGYGAGLRELEIPNVLRLVVGELAESSSQGLTSKISALIVDPDLGPINDLSRHLSGLGAIDVWTVPINKPDQQGIELNCLSPLEKEDLIRKALMSFLGIKTITVERIPVIQKHNT